MHNVRNLAKEASNLQESLHTKYIGKRVMWFRNLSSTQEYARRLIATNGILSSKGYVIISDSQQKGRAGMEINGFHREVVYGFLSYSVQYCTPVSIFCFPTVRQ